MQAKSSLKSKKSDIKVSSNNDSEILKDFFPADDMYQKCGAICKDGTYTSNFGRGVGSHHLGLKHYLYYKKTQVKEDSSDFDLLSQKSTVSNSSTFVCSQCEKISQNSQKQDNSNSSFLKRKTKKASLKPYFKTKAKKEELIQNVQQIFRVYYKDQLQIVQQEVDDQVWLLFASIYNLYQQFNQAFETIKALEDELSSKRYKGQSDFKLKEKLSLQDNQIKLNEDLKSLSKINQDLNKQMKKAQKQNSKMTQQLSEFKESMDNYKAILKIVERQDKQLLVSALNTSKIDIKSLKKQTQSQNRVITRSMSKKSSKKKQQTFDSSIFSSDQSSDFQQQDQTILDFMKFM